MLTPHEHDQMISDIKKTLAILEQHRPPECCLNCDNFDDKTGYCREWRAGVPMDARIAGCEKWVDLIPF